MATTTPTKRSPDLDSLYCINEDGSRNTIHVADVRGRFQSRKKVVWAILIAIYVALPWVEIGGRPAVLFDIPSRHFFFFGLNLTAQDFHLAFFVITGVGFSLFVLSALFGRIWCGYGCPHTVFLDGVFRRVERWVEGTAQQRKRLAESPWNLNKLVRRGGKWAIYFAISMFLSHTFLSYFMGVGEVFDAMLHPPSEHPTAFTFILIFTAIIYFNFTWFREQLCIVICPYGRLQSVLYDRDTIVVGYDRRRGEPRGRYHKGDRGHCIDCYRCVAVCPTGIDIRNGTQMECVGCANCIDACDEVMVKLHQAPGLVRYASQSQLEGQPGRFVRPRLILYGVMLAIGIAVFAAASVSRTPYDAAIVRQQGAPFTLLDGGARNAFVLRLTNKQSAERRYRVEGVEQQGVRWVIPLADFPLGPLADQRMPFFVEVDNASYRRGMHAQLTIKSEDGERVLEVPLLGVAK